MNTPKEYRQRAADCLKLASEAQEIYAPAALTDLATEFLDITDKIEHRSKRDQSGEATDVDDPGFTQPRGRGHHR